MYDGSFGLNRRPFTATPQVANYFAATAIENARTTLARAIQRGEGAGLVIGPSGTGKTLLCMMLAEQFCRSLEVVMLAGGGLSSRRALFQAILYELGRPFRGLDEGEARLAVVDYLMGGDGESHGVVLLVDEAHTLPLRLLEEIRLLTNLIRNGQPMVRLVLAGGPVLEERFASPKLDSFSQRLSSRCYLEALNRTETEEYIVSQINAVGGRGDEVFPSETCSSVFQATGGVPRLINQVCDHALLLAYVAGRQEIDQASVEEAWSDLQQLPTPWSGDAKREQPGAGVIEFGSLDDQAEAAPTVAMPAASAATELKISSAEYEQENAEVESDQQIHRIEELLAEVDDEFQPAGSIGPEVELKFGSAEAHPFLEEFEHEELVADRYAASAPTVLATAREGKKSESALWGESDVQVESDTVALPIAPALAESVEQESAVSLAAVAEMELSEAEPALELTAASFEPPSLPIPPARRDYRRLFAKLQKG